MTKESELDEMICNKFMNALYSVPIRFRAGTISIPLLVQHAIMRHFSHQHGMEMRGSELTSFQGHRVVLGYEMAFVIFNPESIEDFHKTSF